MSEKKEEERKGWSVWTTIGVMILGALVTAMVVAGVAFMCVVNIANRMTESYPGVTSLQSSLRIAYTLLFRRRRRRYSRYYDLPYR